MGWRDATLGAFLDALATPGPAPAAGSAAAATCALAAALVELSEGAGTPRGRQAAQLRAEALELVDRDADDYAALAAARRAPAASRERLAAARERASASPLAVATIALDVASLARAAQEADPTAKRADAAAAVELARAACLAAVRLVEANLTPAAEHPALVARAQQLASSARAA